MLPMHFCLFDIDGTLLSSGGAGKAAMETALATEFGVTELRGKVPFSGRTDRAIVRDLFALHEVDESPANWERFLTAYFRYLPGCLARHKGRVLPGVGALLERLASRTDVGVGLLTGNVRVGARLKLEHYGIFHHFPFGGFGDLHLDRCDVAREVLGVLHERRNGSVDLNRVWVIGDTPLDIACARAIGARTAAVATGQHGLDELAAARPDLLFTDLSDPTELIAMLD
jgi:phosphoglycolate phosphatase